MPLLWWTVLGGCSGGPTPGAAAPVAEQLAAGPLRWLMLPDEARQAKQLRTYQEQAAFVAAFWERRNPDPLSAGNECARRFDERVAAADRLYAEGGTRGSLTDRGRALVLLGAPPVLRYGLRRLPAWDSGRGGAHPAVQDRMAAVETWIYPLGKLPPELRALLASEPAAQGGEAVLVFLSESPERTRLLEGGRVLELAARALVRR